MRVYFETDSYVVDEERGPAIVCIVREGEIADTLTIHVSTVELIPPQATGWYNCQILHNNSLLTVTLSNYQSAHCNTADEDFLPLSGVPIQFRPDEYRVCRPINIFRDEEFEGAENFTAVITSVPEGVVTGNDTTIITIVDGKPL